jgi:NADPH:quinone reductase-like Zn-dependent oxidoreductase
VGPAVFAAKDCGAVVIAGVLKEQLDSVKNLGADRVVALDDPAAFTDLQKVDVVANTVRGKTAEDLMGKVKEGGILRLGNGRSCQCDRVSSGGHGRFRIQTGHEELRIYG